MAGNPLITFSSDFGTAEYYVGAVKGAILRVCGEARIVDVGHNIPSHDILSAAFTLAGYATTYPAKTIHLIIVDPGVGSSRRCVAVETERQFYIAPDNGVLSLMYEKERVINVVSIEAPHYMHSEVCPTFHGRDIFGPAAAWLARGVSILNFGPTISDYKRLTLPPVKDLGGGTLEGFVLHIDKFGNVITNFSAEIVAKFGGITAGSRFTINGRTVSSFVTTYSEGNSSEPFVLLGSSGYYEVALSLRRAAQALEAKRGMKVQLTLKA